MELDTTIPVISCRFEPLCEATLSPSSFKAVADRTRLAEHQDRNRIAQKVFRLRARAAVRQRIFLQSQLASQVKQLESEYRSRYTEIIRQIEGESLELVLSIAREVIGADIKGDLAALQTRIQRALQQLPAVQMDISLLPQEGNVGGNGNATLSLDGGSVTLSWEKHFDHIAERLRARLQIAKDIAKEAA
jgi:Flagellar assembly protein FliH